MTKVRAKLHATKTEAAPFSKKDQKAIDEIHKMVFDFFEKDQTKIDLWFKSKNPLLGGVTPRQMIILGKVEKLLRIFKDAREGNMP